MPTHNHIVVVEDDAVARATLVAYLEKEGYRASAAPDGETLRRLFARNDVDLVLLDINLPDDDGFSLLREIRRQSEIGVIMVTGKGEDVDRIVALELGADDYVVKPFNMRELFARAKNLLRRTTAIRRLQQTVAPEAELQFAGWTLSLTRRALTSPDGGDVRLTPFEFELLAALARAPGCVLSRDQLIDRVGGRDRAPNDRTIDVLISRLRHKMEPAPGEPRLIVTVQGAGYVLAASVASDRAE